VESETLTDGSSVFNVVIQDGEGQVKFPCMSLWHADQLAGTMKLCIDGYAMGTTNIVHVY
jgi:hypothetical protein